MRGWFDFPIIFLLSLLQVSFLPLNFLLGFLIFLLLKKDFYYLLPRLVFASLLLALLSSGSLGLVLLTFTAVVSLIGFLKTRLPPAFFIRASFVIFSIPIAEIIYQQLFVLWGRL